jgi:hypothetical protein
MKRTREHLLGTAGVGFFVFAAACAQQGPGSATGTGGSTGSGGNTASGGVTGTSDTGGSTGTGGSTSTGGNTGTGGIVSTGGSTGTGGATSTGGVSGTGGSASGGATGTGGSGAAGATGTGGGGQIACPSLPTSPTDAGSIIQFNDNGGWCWYQDERAVVDTKANKLIIGTTASGGSRNGQNEAVIYDLATSKGTRYTLPSTLATSNVDDHNSPALLIRPDGKYLAQWSGHRVDCISRFSIFDGTAWGAEQKVDWTPFGCPWAGASTNMVTYSNPWYIGTNIFTMVRSVGTDPAALTSTNDGQSWSYNGKLASSKQVGYVAGYFKYWGDNTGRIDFNGTEAHPRDNDNNLWAGYIQNGMVYNSLGTAISTFKDSNATTTNAKDISAFSQVFKTGSTIGGVKLCRAWNYDMVRYADGTVAILMQARADTCTSTPSGSDPDKRAVYARFDGTKWNLTYLVKMGPKLYAAEEDYTGLAALDPDNPHVIYISTVYDPRNDTTKTAHHEIYEGVTCDNGATWQWAPITQNSTVDQLRPIVPKWDANHLALIWLSGTYTSAQQYAFKVVGLVKSSNP